MLVFYLDWGRLDLVPKSLISVILSTNQNVAFSVLERLHLLLLAVFLVQPEVCFSALKEWKIYILLRDGVTCAAITLCLSVIRMHLEHVQFLNLQLFLCPFSHEMTPWFLHRAHFGFRAPLSVLGYGKIDSSALFKSISVLIIELSLTAWWLMNWLKN